MDYYLCFKGLNCLIVFIAERAQQAEAQKSTQMQPRSEKPNLEKHLEEKIQNSNSKSGFDEDRIEFEFRTIIEQNKAKMTPNNTLFKP